MTDSDRTRLLQDLERFPACIIPAIKLLPEADPELKATLVRRIAAAVGDEAALRTTIGIDPAEFAEFYPDMRHPDLSTEETIDSFLDRFAPPSATMAPAEIDSIIAPPAIDYAAMIEEEKPRSTDSGHAPDPTDSLIDSFLSAVPPKAPAKRHAAAPEPAPEPRHAVGLSESLAKVMIKNGNYSKALEIITELNLKNPKKSIYFADQIRFLKKLIANQSYPGKQ